MKRAPIVLAGTAAGLAGVLAYNISPSASSVVSSVPAAQTASASTTSVPATTANSTSSSSQSATKTTKTTTAAPKASAKKRTATGTDVSFQYGDVEVKVTKRRSRITDISIVRFNITDQHSQEIDQVAVPQLRQQALAAQSAKIDGVSGASYTSAAYEQSLQSALDKLA